MCIRDSPGPELRNGRLQPLKPGQVIDGIERPNREVCDIGSCKGASTRDLNTAGCWQNEPPSALEESLLLIINTAFNLAAN